MGSAMPLPVIDGVCRCTVAGQITGGGRWSNTWHARRIDLVAPSEGEINALHTELALFYGTQVMSRVPAATTIDGIDYTPLDGSSGAFHIAMSSTGSGSINALPAEVAEVLTLRTALRGRRHRGRIFLPSFASNSWDSVGRLGTTVASDIVTAAGVLRLAAIVSGWEIGVASYGHYINRLGVSVSWTPEFQPATNFSMDILGDVMRSRKQ